MNTTINNNKTTNVFEVIKLSAITLVLTLICMIPVHLGLQKVEMNSYAPTTSSTVEAPDWDMETIETCVKVVCFVYNVANNG